MINFKKIIGYGVILITIFSFIGVINKGSAKNNDNIIENHEEISTSVKISEDEFTINIDDISMLVDGKVDGIVYFGRNTCEYCLKFNEVLKKEFEKIENKDIFKFDTDEWRGHEKFDEVLSQYNVMAVPSLVKVKDGVVIDTFIVDFENDNSKEMSEKVFGFLS